MTPADRSQIERLRSQLTEALARLDDMQFRLDELLVLPPEVEDAERFRFTPAEQRIWSLLKKRQEKPVFLESIRAAANPAWYDNTDSKVPSVHICKMRKKISGSEYRIKNQWSVGYSLHRVVQ